MEKLKKILAALETISHSSPETIGFDVRAFSYCNLSRKIWMSISVTGLGSDSGAPENVLRFLEKRINLITINPTSASDSPSAQKIDKYRDKHKHVRF
jgi:hypothetical protein